jgi:glycine/D-amino acid oxidase-like deaminating enzyme
VKSTPYWLDDEAQPLPPSKHHAHPDVIVIGGGVTGCSAALRLAEAGVRVRVHEARRVAGGASGRNGGFALRGTASPYDEAVANLGPGAARRLMQLTEEGLDLLERLAGDAFRRVGSLRLAADGAELAALRREHDALAADSFEVELVEQLDAPLDRLYEGALLHPPDGAIDPGRWVRRLAAAAAASGADIVEASGISIDAAEASADAVLVATDGATASVLRELKDAVVATRGQVLATEPQAELRYGRPHYARGGFDYWQQLPDGRLVLGGRRDASFATEDTDVEETTPLIQERLDKLAAELLGREPRVTHRWAGIWGASRDGLPLVGRVAGRDRTWVAAGYSGHGNVLGLVCGRLVAAAVMGEAVADLAPFDPARFG